MIRCRCLAGSLVACVAVSAASCAPTAEPVVAIHVASRPAEGPCTAEVSSDAQWRSEVDSFRLTVNAVDMQTPITADSDGSGLVLENVPAGPARSVGLFGLSTESVPLWRGVVNNVTVVPNENLELDVLLARVGDMSCARGADEPRAFHTATVLKDGRILVVGGATSTADASQTCGAGCRRMEATSSAAVYEPTTGTFRAVAPLEESRMFHTATLLDDGRVVIAGGSSKALISSSSASSGPFPIEPQDPRSTVEVFDPESNRFTTEDTDPSGSRVFAAAVLTDSGDVLIAGGIPGTPSANSLNDATDSTTLCGGTPMTCREGPPMGARRAGHLLFRIEPGPNTMVSGIVAWGGSIEEASDTGMELLSPDASSFRFLNVEQMFASRNVFFAAGARYVNFRMLAAGGLIRRDDGSFQPATATNSVPGVPHAPVFVFDATVEPSGAISVGPNDSEWHLQGTRVFAAATPLPGGKRALIAGGFTGLSFEPASSLDLFDQSPPPSVGPIVRAGKDLPLREARGGAVAAANGDGTVVFLGGVTSASADPSSIAATAEIFADPLTPPGVAE